MKAVLYHQYGSADQLHLEEIPKPVPKENEVLIKICAASINDWDWGLLHGVPFANRMMSGLFKPKKIQILGSDIAGHIEAIGKNVSHFKSGDEVFGDLSDMHGTGWGGFAEYVCATENVLLFKPATMSYKQAAALPQTGALAIQGLDQGKIKSGDRVLINGASGGVGTLAIQIAKSYDTEVTAVCSGAKLELVRSLGADHVIDYQQQDFTKNGQHYNLILDVKGFHSIFDYRRALAPNGRYVMLGGASSRTFQVLLLGPLLTRLGNKKMGLLFLKPNKGLDSLVALFQAGKLKPVIDQHFPLSQATEAMRYYESWKAKGKVILTMEEA